MPPPPHKSHQKMQERHRRCQVALQHFLVTLAMIGCEFAPNFYHVHLWGVRSGSLGGFKLVGWVGGVD